MELGVHLWDFNYPNQPASIAPTLARAVETAEDIGMTWVSVMDHYFQMEAVAPAEHPMLEGYTTLGYLAAHSSSAQLGVLVTGVTYRHPGLLAKIATTLDVLSEGRAVLGLGAAWYDREHHALGVPFPATAERFERLEEAIQIVLQMWDPENDGPYEGRHYRLEETLCQPRPMSRPHPPLMVGGVGERKTLRLVAQYADACNFNTSIGLDQVGARLDVLRRHCDEVGRDYDEIRKTMLLLSGPLAQGDLDGFAAEVTELDKLGMDLAIVMPLTHEPDRWLDETARQAATIVADL
jgi:F420-dependent oxidoreductase-like protein